VSELIDLNAEYIVKPPKEADTLENVVEVKLFIYLL
jgi:hypothetical protein